MTWRVIAALGLVLSLSGCAGMSGDSSGGGRAARCYDRPDRGGNYSSNQPLVLFFCAESP